ncbi:MAG: rhamnogalacturonan acetylesterase [Bacteroidota bacterium]
MKRFMRKNAGLSLLLTAVVLLSSFMFIKPQDKPTFFMVGDSTVKNGRDDGQKMGPDGQWGWGHYIHEYFDTTKINIENDALGGTSSRSFMNMGLWDKVLAKVKPGDFVIMQFGHNDGGPLDDTARARGTIKGVGDEQKEVFNPMKYMQKQEVVHSYGWYMRKYINDAKAKGAVAIICSPIPRNDWKDGKAASRNMNNSYGSWSKEVAQQTGAYFIDLNTMASDFYDQEGEAKVKATYFHADHTHTIEAGAKVNTKFVIDGIKSFPDLALNKYLK